MLSSIKTQGKMAKIYSYTPTIKLKKRNAVFFSHKNPLSKILASKLRD